MSRYYLAVNPKSSVRPVLLRVRLLYYLWSMAVIPPKLTLTNPVESLAIHPVEPTYDQMGNHPYKKRQNKCKGR
jgi:hypothetical protein